MSEVQMWLIALAIVVAGATVTLCCTLTGYVPSDVQCVKAGGVWIQLSDRDQGHCESGRK